MSADGAAYSVRVTDSVLSTTILMHPTDAKEAVKNAAARYTILDPISAPPPSVPFPPFVGTFVIATLPTAVPPSLGSGGLPVGSRAIITNGAAAPVMGTAPSTTGAVTCEVVWNGSAWGYG